MAHATGKPNEHMSVPIRAELSHLNDTDKQLLDELIEATKLTNDIFLLQTNQDLDNNGGVFDQSKPNNFYPQDVTREEIEAYVSEHPDQRDDVLSPFTVVTRNDTGFTTTPYSEHYQAQLSKVSKRLETAATLTQNPSFKTFLQNRAEAFKTNEYRQSDIDWINVEDAPFELTIGPYENYEDKLFGVKRDVEAILGVVLPKETADAKFYQEQVTHFDAFLGERYGYAAATNVTPMIVMDEVIAGGSPLYSYVPMAFNLPNDADIQKEVGSKKVFVRNVMQAKMERITKKIAERVLEPGVATRLEPSTHLSFVIGHESSHGLSFRFEGKAFLELGSPLEEGKADVFGMIFLYFLAERGVIDQVVAENAVIGNLTDGLRQMRFGLDEAHAVGTRIQYHAFLQSGAMRFTEQGLAFDAEKFEQTLWDLGDKLYALSQTRDYEKAKAFVNEWAEVPEQVRTLIATFDGIPVDIDPQFDV